MVSDNLRPKYVIIKRYKNIYDCICFYILDHETLPFVMVAALMGPALVITLMPFQTTNPSASVLKCYMHRSKTFFLGLRTGWMSPWANSSWKPSKKTRSPSSPSGINNSTAVWSAFEAQTTIPLDRKPAKGLGFKLAITITFPFICSNGTNFCRPEAISLT